MEASIRVCCTENFALHQIVCSHNLPEACDMRREIQEGHDREMLEHWKEEYKKGFDDPLQKWFTFLVQREECEMRRKMLCRRQGSAIEES